MLRPGCSAAIDPRTKRLAHRVGARSNEPWARSDLWSATPSRSRVESRRLQALAATGAEIAVAGDKDDFRIDLIIPSPGKPDARCECPTAWRWPGIAQLGHVEPPKACKRITFMAGLDLLKSLKEQREQLRLRSDR